MPDDDTHEEYPSVADALLHTRMVGGKPKGIDLPFSDLLIRLREARGITKAELAKRADLGASTITRFEQGERAPERSTVLNIANALVLPGVDRDRLLAAAGFRSELWDDADLIGLMALLNDPAISDRAKEEARTTIGMVVTYLRAQRMTGGG